MQKGQAAEAEEREIWLRNNGFTSINKMLAYNRGLTALNIHFPPNYTTGTKEKIRLLYEGMKILARKIKRDPTIREIHANSWIVTEHPEFLQRMGFKPNKKINERDRKEIKRKAGLT